LAITPFDAILDRALRNDRWKSTDGEELISKYRSTTPSYRPVYRFSRTCQGQAAFGGGCVSGRKEDIPLAQDHSAIYCWRIALPILLRHEIVH
jgi:hypothetical protein